MRKKNRGWGDNTGRDSGAREIGSLRKVKIIIGLPTALRGQLSHVFMTC